MAQPTTDGTTPARKTAPVKAVATTPKATLPDVTYPPGTEYVTTGGHEYRVDPTTGQITEQLS